MVHNENNEQHQDSWLMDDGIGTGLFSGDILNQVDAKQGQELEDYIEDVKAGARVAIDQSIGILTPWFFSNMPQFYYQTTPREEKVRDLHAVITGHIFESKQTLQLWNRDRSKTTFLAPGNHEHIFQSVADSIAGLNVKHGAMFTSNDRLLLIASFFTADFRPVDLTNDKCKYKLDSAAKLLAGSDPADLDNFLKNLDHDMVVHATPERLARLYKLYELELNREDAVTHLIPSYYQEYARLDIAYKKMPIGKVLPPMISLFERYGFQLTRTVMATVNTHTETPVTIFTFIIRHESGNTIDEKFVPFLKVNKAAKSLRWVDIDRYDDLWKISPENKAEYSLNETNLIRAMSVWCQVFLSKINPYYYSEERIRQSFTRNPDILRGLVHYFRAKFDPRKSKQVRAKIDEKEVALKEQFNEVTNRISKDIFEESLNFLKHILKTNYFYLHKTGLSFRLDPTVLDTKYYPNRPFGFFFLIGRGYRGFHVRFRDTARGGMRIVMPRDISQYEVAFAGLFDEVIGLSYAQQLKNKDIPEGGAKAVLLLSPGADKESAAIGAVDSILNLITTTRKAGRPSSAIIDYFGEEEYIYLGPDENLTNDLIEAFVCQARREGYRFPNAFMSSKPQAGINHKEYGVTSEGVNVYLENLLQELGINPHEQAFTIKMTGGPDGDVAGNELKILYREYKDNARVLAIGDGFGAAYDPKGLNWDELLRLVRESRSICDFDPKALSDGPGAFVIPADNKENIRIRNTLYATVNADIFIPAGGRPYTVNADNWSNFLREDGTLTVRGIVEGANIFFTEEARDRLQERGVLIFKDSSANKCGVICSSYEIISSLILEPEEFMAIKEQYVRQVLDKLREKADFEAKILLREFRERGRKVTLVQLSKELSNVINRVTDLVSASLDKLTEEDFRSPLHDKIILGYVPQVLAKDYADRILNNIPRSYRQAMLSADTAARLVYTEGIKYFEDLDDKEVVRTVKIYVDEELRVLELLELVEKSDLGEKDDIKMILRMAGARTLTQRGRIEWQKRRAERDKRG